MATRTSRKSSRSGLDDAIQLTVPEAIRSKYITSLQPMLATLTDAPFDDPDWLYEIKLDGIRAVTYIRNGKARIFSRNGIEIGSRYPELDGIEKTLPVADAILDGEIIATNDKGQPSFQALQSRSGLTQGSDIRKQAQVRPIYYYIFDMVYCEGFNLMPGLLIHRKALLKEFLEVTENIRYSEHTVGKGLDIYKKAKRAGLEGIIAKKQQSAYVQKRSKDWLKIKAIRQQEVVIAGYTQPRGSRALLGALVTAVYDNGVLEYAGHVGGGFNHKSLESVYKLLQPLKTDRSPFGVKIKTNEPVQWVKPVLVCEVKFAEWTSDGKLRQPIFLGLREDKAPSECVREK